MPPKTKTRSKSKNIINSKYKKVKIKNKNVVNVHIHRAKSSQRNTQQASKPIGTSHSLIMDTFQPRLPITHPFVNVPVALQNAAPLQSPVNVYVNGNPLTHNTSAPSALSTAATTMHTPVPQRSYSFSAPSVPLFTPHSSTPLRPTPKRSEPVKSDSSNRYDILSEDIDTELSHIASVTGEDQNIIKDTLEHLNIIHGEKFSKTASRDKDWTVDTFIRHNLPFLYKQGIIDPHQRLPAKVTIKNRIHTYIRNHKLFDTPHHSGTNKDKIYYSELYKNLDNHIRAGTAPYTQVTPKLNEEENLEESSIEYLLNLAKERKIKLADNQLGNKEYLIKKLKEKGKKRRSKT